MECEGHIDVPATSRRLKPSTSTPKINEYDESRRRYSQLSRLSNIVHLSMQCRVVTVGDQAAKSNFLKTSKHQMNQFHFCSTATVDANANDDERSLLHQSSSRIARQPDITSKLKPQYHPGQETRCLRFLNLTLR